MDAVCGCGDKRSSGDVTRLPGLTQNYCDREAVGPGEGGGWLHRFGG